MLIRLVLHARSADKRRNTASVISKARFPGSLSSRRPKCQHPASRLGSAARIAFASFLVIVTRAAFISDAPLPFPSDPCRTGPRPRDVRCSSDLRALGTRRRAGEARRIRPRREVVVVARDATDGMEARLHDQFPQLISSYFAAYCFDAPIVTDVPRRIPIAPSSSTHVA